MKNKNYLYFILFYLTYTLGLFSCTDSIYKESKEEESSVDVNEDNKIYIDGREFIFSYKYYDKENRLLTCFITDTTKMLWALKNRADTLDNKGYPIDKIKLLVHYMITDSVSFNQTPIEYSYLTNKGLIGFKEQTSISENSKMVVINVPRFYSFYITELISAPLIIRPLNIGRSWFSTVFIPEETIKFMNLDSTVKQNGGIENRYNNVITDTINVETKMGKLFCYVINTVNYDKRKLPYLTSYFNEKYGFIKLNYFNLNSRIEYNLESVIDK